MGLPVLFFKGSHMRYGLLMAACLLGMQQADVQAATGTASVAARFTTSTCGNPCDSSRSRQWYFWRGQDRVEIRNVAGSVGEIWKRDPQGRVSFIYLEPAQRRGIEYTPNELNFVHNQHPWEQLASLVSPQALEKLTPSGDAQFLGLPAKLYKGQLAGKQVEVTWLPELQLAARLENIHPDGRTVTELQAFLNDGDKAKAITDRQLQEFLLVDYADVGDLEGDTAMDWLKHSLAPGHESHHH